MKQVTKVMLVSFLVNTFLALGKIIAGFFASSKSLIADGIHSFSDLSTDLIAMVGNFLSAKPADEKHPYGHGRLEYLTSTIIGFVIILLGLALIGNAMQEKNVVISWIVMLVSIFTITIKFLLARYIIRKGKEYHNEILIASGTESSTDVISSIVVFISAIFLFFQNQIPIFKYADVVATIIVGIFIVKTGFGILKENVSTLLGEKETDEEYIQVIQEIISKHPLVKNIDALNLLKFGPYYKLDAEISMNSSISIKDSHAALDEIEEMLKNFDERLQYQNIHINPYEEE